MKILVISLVSVVLIAIGGFYFLKQHTKKYSPEETIEHTIKDATITIFYNRPYKKDRKIFGGLVPFGEVWRTGANEATTFTASSDLVIDGTLLKKGTYTLWTIPNPSSWKIIFNSKPYHWAVHIDGTLQYESEFDVLTIEVPVMPLFNRKEQFSIYFESANDFSLLYLAWDRTAVAIPIRVATKN
ncbi:DUF2911 domain-containing protein [Aquimarina sp. U1-2]|uniref:DUF2911 domain-containing protein n=1 Tax=Aquimarina sp. U1-2 TaxID=2823141 RepID=UPI001FF033F1|nr:DUF2911 domain-containing protein [Aquimarina sp. U1-2]